MSARKVPLRASSRLDIQARLPHSEPAPAENSGMRAAPRVAWLSDMLTPDTNSLGVIRLLLALAVLVSHSVYLTTGQAELEPLYRWTNYTLGQHGVQMFFFLSGILVAQSLFASRSLRDYATARALRIFPALFVCVLLTALVMGPLVTALPSVEYLKQQGTAVYIAKTASLWSGSAQLPGVFLTNTVSGAVNTSVWTLKYEVLCYALLGLGGLAVLKTQRWREAAIIVFGLWAAAVLYKPVGLELHGGAKSTLQVLQYFVTFFGLGAVVYALRQWIPVHALVLIPLGGLFAVSLGGRFQEPVTAMFLGYLMLWLATFRFGALRAFTNRNDYSYATYLYHMPVSQVLLYLWPQMELVPLIMATAGIVLGLAFLSWELVERPALALRHRIWAPSRASVEAGPARAPEQLRRGIASPAAASFAPRETKATGDAPLKSRAPLRSKPGVIEPGAAQVWRPMPAPKKLRIQDDIAEAAAPATSTSVSHLPTGSVVPLAPVQVQAASAAGATSRYTSFSAPRDLLSGSAGTNTFAPTPVEPIVETLPPRVPANRIAFATKRPAASNVAGQDDPRADIPAAVEPTRAVVAVTDGDTDASTKPRLRVAQPRSPWTRPTGLGRPQPV